MAAYLKWFQKPLPAIGAHLGVEFHNHILAGMDDGAEKWEESLQMLLFYAERGYQKVICTPHVSAEFFPNKRLDIMHAADTLRRIAQEQEIPIEIRASAEYLVDTNFLRLLEQDEVLPIAGKYLLVETGFFEPPAKLEEILFSIRMKGYFPIVAHPERYFYAQEKLYAQWRERGYLFQVNIASFVGGYGSDARQKAHLLLKKNWIDFVGTDLHKPNQIPTLYKAYNESFWKKLLPNLKNPELL